LSQQFASRGLQFFKVNKTVTHVSVARPQFLDLETTPVSDNVRKIVEFVHTHPKCSRRKLFEALAPSALLTTQPPAEGAPVPELTPEASAIISDLHWLVHQGHVIEFANGTLETAKKPLPKPPKPEPAKPQESQPETGVTLEPPRALDGTSAERTAALTETVTETVAPDGSAPAENATASENSPA